MRAIRARAAARLCAVTIALAVATGTAAQQAGSPAPARQPEVPFVTGLRAEAFGGGVRLTWKDSPDVLGSCLIYRAVSEISALNFDGATLAGRVSSGVESWVDTSAEGKGYFYAIVMLDTTGVRYPLFVPYRNVTTTAVSTAASRVPSPRPAPSLSPVSSPGPAAASTVSAVAAAVVPAASTQPAVSAPAASSPGPAGAATPTRITGLSAVLTGAGDAVTVSFASSNPSRDLLLFWSSAPLTVPMDLLRAGAAAPLDPGTTSYVLPVLPGATFWFAVLDAGLYKIGQFPLVPGLNASSVPIQVPGKSGDTPTASTARRALPLPSLSLDLVAQSGSPGTDAGTDTGAPELPSVKPVSAATMRAIDLLLKEVTKPPVVRTLKILNSDNTPQAGGEAAQLLEIVQGPFRRNDMDGAQQELLGFLSVPRSSKVAAHARFYLGQSYWFQGRMREALLEFLIAADFYSPESQPWIDASVTRLEAENR